MTQTQTHVHEPFWKKFTDKLNQMETDFQKFVTAKTASSVDSKVKDNIKPIDDWQKEKSKVVNHKTRDLLVTPVNHKEEDKVVPKVQENMPREEKLEPNFQKVEQKVEPKVEPKYEPKVEPIVEPKYEPKVEPVVEHKYESSFEPKQPKHESSFEPKVEKSEPKVEIGEPFFAVVHSPVQHPTSTTSTTSTTETHSPKIQMNDSESDSDEE